MEKLGKNNFLFASVAYGQGYSDKLCDYIADCILDQCLTIDPKARVNIDVSAS